MEIHKQGMAQQTLGGGPASSSSGKVDLKLVLYFGCTLSQHVSLLFP